MQDVRQTREHAAYLKAIGWTIERSPAGVLAYIRKLPLLGVSVIKIQRVASAVLDYDWMAQLARTHRAVVLYVETIDAALTSHGFRADGGAMLPTKTLVVDLGVSKTRLLAEMKSKTRYNIGLAQRKRLEIKIVTGDTLIKNTLLFNEYYELMEHNSHRLHTFEMPRKWLAAQLAAFGNKSFVVMVREKEVLAAAAMFVCSSDSVFYSHNGSTAEGRQLFAPTLAVWQGMLEGKRRDLHWFDFDGIYDERYPLPRWKGFTRFKLGFGGETVVFPPVQRCFLPALRLH